jgi:metal-responsive CopG/Arc/MetJ family transcriptional regulator
MQMSDEKHQLKDQRIPVLMTADEVEAIDAYRAKQRPLPTRSQVIRQAVRRMVEPKAKK